MTQLSWGSVAARGGMSSREKFSHPRVNLHISNHLKLSKLLHIHRLSDKTVMPSNFCLLCIFVLCAHFISIWVYNTSLLILLICNVIVYKKKRICWMFENTKSWLQGQSHSEKTHSEVLSPHRIIHTNNGNQWKPLQLEVKHNKNCCACWMDCWLFLLLI